MRSSKLYLMCVVDPLHPLHICTSNWRLTAERSTIIQSVDVFYKCVCWFITYAEASVHSKTGGKKCISILTERQAVDSSGNKSTSARLHANSRATLNGETIDEKTDKNIKYSDIPFRQYQKRPDVGSWSCYHEANDRHWKEFLWIFNHIKVFYGMQINGNFFWLWRGKNMPINPIIWDYNSTNRRHFQFALPVSPR